MADAEGKWPAGFPPGFTEKFVPELMLGKGSFGSVWLARQLPLDRRVALKILHHEVLGEDAEVGRFSDEARITAALHHPHVVVVMDHGVESGVPWIAYEYLEGRDLREQLPADGLPWRDALTAVIQVADALDHAHQRGILHRDIKPDNVIEVSPGHYKVADFGLAKWTRQSHMWTATGTVVGSPAYLSPEQIDGFEPGPGSDQYALGVTLFELLTGKLPFRDSEEMPIMLAHLKQPPPRPGDLKPLLPRVLDLVVERALAKKPEERFGSAAELKTALEAILRGDSSAVMVRMRARVDARAKSAGRVARAATGGEGGTPRKPGPIWWAVAVAMPLIAGAFYGSKVYRSRGSEPETVVSAAPAPVSYKELAVVPLPPRAIRVRYELERVPPDGVALPVVVNGVERTALKLASVAGSVVVTGIAPGSRVRVGTEELTTPRGLPTWIDSLAADRHASVFVRFLEPSSVEISVIEQPAGNVVLQQRSPRAHRVLQRVPNLKPGTRYSVRVKATDAQHFLASGLAEHSFVTLNARDLEPIRVELKNLRSKDHEDRVRAAGFLRIIPDPDAVPLVTAALSEPGMLNDHETTTHLLATLARMRDPRALPGFAAALKAAPNARSRLFVVRQIAEIQDPAGFDLVLAECEKGGLPPEDEASVALGHALLASDPVRARELFQKVSNDAARAAPTLRRAAVEGLAVLGGAESVAALGRLARFAPRELGPRAAVGLGALGGEAARGELVGLLSGGQRPGDAGPATENALRALGRCGQPEDAGAVVALLEAPLGARLKRAAVTALAGLGGAEAEAEVSRRITDPDPGVVTAATWAAGQLKLRAAVPALIRRLKAPGGTAGRAPRALAQIGDPAAEAPLFELATSRALITSPGQLLDRAEALWALGVLGAKRALPELIRATGTGDMYARFRAVEALGWLADPSGRPALEAIAGDAKGAPTLREAAQRSLAWIKDGRPPAKSFLVVDPAFPPVRTGVILVVGESFQAQSQGVCLLDPATLAAPADASALPAGSRPARQSLLGVVGAAGRCYAGQGETAPCARAAEGELLLYALSPTPDERAVGFLTAWVTR